MERYDITIQMYSADASGTQYVWEKVPAEEGDFVLYADAQATIAALQARVQELEDDRSAWKEIAQDWSAAAKLAEQPEKFYEGYSAAVMNAMQALLTKARAEFTQRTAELQAAKREVDVWKEKAELRGKEACAQRAELERVSLLSSHNERRFEMLEEKYKELRTLILTLPKVEVVTGDTVVNIVQQYNFHQWMLRALQHRQGMEE